MQVMATETGYYGGILRHRGQEFAVPDGYKLAKWMVEKGKPLPTPLKPFVRTLKDLVAQAHPDPEPEKAINTLSGKARAEASKFDLQREAKTATPSTQQQSQQQQSQQPKKP